ncbi:3-deoxy-manno-octulosonate cytidylyltransferase [Salegentibacter salarius]|jgi:3-deoxy-manno-octulosonate cytidylyltransferase (CMP-KDO synthetase)|uniref:3-deoxy-manno-octulosonate cytidylyltransferase n=1 Tax=Salegentibacter salarius TaxID=435906 RepID=A0A2N0TSQ8_9FLAO|nr:3-deoxy-manno-octulosonate cytidylyltransferase [Salegentibacter salarius]OEY72005.1 3-deoxy-D-manno-octulosonate cytidylyltransferase [Salegentibacter salarius]PKD17783.1 3-deoxy-manno-octulosonate cytidylyltransferase [Salegentibacter salarius]
MNNPLKIIAMIPARYEASRFPGKLLKDLNGKTVITRTYEAAKNTELFEEVYVVTDSDEIFAEINKNGGKAIKSNKEHECGSDRIAEAVQDMDVDIVVNVQGDEPFIDKDSLAKLLVVFREDDASAIDLASLKTALSESDEITNPNNVKVITNKNDFAMYFSRFPIPYPRNTDAQVTYFKHLGIYAFRKQALIDFYNLPMLSLESAEKIEAIRFLEYGKNIKMVETQMQTIGIDTPEDLDKAREIWNN